MRPVIVILCLIIPLRAQRPLENAGKNNPVAGQPEAIALGQKLFRGGCAACHGANGEGGRGPQLTDGRHLRGMNDERLFTAIRSGIPGTDMPASTLPDDKIWQIAAFVRSIVSPAFETKPAGDVDAGQGIFFGKGGCTGCHTIRGGGGSLGPDLSNIGALRSVQQITDSILRPNERIVDGFQGVTAVTRDGRRIQGVAKNHTNYSLQILDAQGALHLLDTADLREVTFAKQSLMPPAQLSAAELTNLVAYLSRQSMRSEVRPSSRRN